MLIYYNNLKLAPYSHLIKFRFADARLIMSYTYDYSLDYSCWSKLMQDALEFYNAVVDLKEHKIFQWITGHLSNLVNGLERFINSSEFYFDNLNEPVKGDDFWEVKTFKIAEALKFIENIKSLPVQVDPKQYVNRILELNQKFLPILKSKLAELNGNIRKAESAIKKLDENKTFTLYLKLYDKIRYSKCWKWEQEEHKTLIVNFIKRVFHLDSTVNQSHIHEQIEEFLKQKAQFEKLQRERDAYKGTLEKLTKDLKRIEEFFEEYNQQEQDIETTK